jgi:hypothetical protein
MRWSGLWAAGVVLGVSSLAGAAGLDFTGDPALVSDPAGDSRTWSGYISPDLLRASVVVMGDSVRLRAGLAAPMDPNVLLWFAFDTDRNPSTGKPGSNGFGADAGVMGSELFVYTSTSSAITAYDSAMAPVALPAYTFTRFDDGMEIMLPLSVFGSADGPMDYKVESRLFMGSAAMGGFDYLTDVGSPASRSVVPEPAGLAWTVLTALGLAVRRRKI